jgi:predicted peptidase
MKGASMRATLMICSALLIVTTSLPSVFGDEAQDKSPLKPAHLSAQVTVEVDYLIYVPEDYESKDAWPLLLFLHGAGERGDDLNRVKVHGPPKLIEAGQKFPFVVVAPQCPKGKWWEAAVLTTLIDSVVENNKIAQDQIFVTGLSMGGFGTWDLAAHTPDRFAAIVPICGGGKPFSTRRFTHLPTWVFHGGKDSVVPLKQSEEMVEALKARGGNVRLTVYPEAGHDSWTEAYANPELYEWMLAQKRGKKEE